MASAETSLIPVSIDGLTADKQLKLFASLKQGQFSGQLTLQSLDGTDWMFYLFCGRLIYATGGQHPVRRWVRSVAKYCPEIALDTAILKFELVQAKTDLTTIVSWEYQLLSNWLKQDRLNRQQATQIIFTVITEVFFEITQVKQVIYEAQPRTSLPEQLVLMNAEQAIRQAEALWTACQTAKVADYSPNLAPIIKQPSELKQRTPPQVYQMLETLLDGQRTLQDISLKLNRNVIAVTQSLLPYLKADLIGLSKVADFESPAPPPKASKPVVKAPLIACVDDSLMVCQTMERILSQSGYQVTTITDGLRALATILTCKPDLIFLDLMMPNTNGYEICSHLRRLPAFREVPIVILTGNDGVIDRVHAKMVGASAFLGKPIQPDVVLETLKKYLHARMVG